MSRYDQFIGESLDNKNYREDIKGNGGFDYFQQLEALIQLSSKMNRSLLCYLFDEKLGSHLAVKYMECGRDLLSFLSHIDRRYQFFILHELKTNETLFAHC